MQKAQSAQKHLQARHATYNKLDGLLHLAALAEKDVLKSARVQPFERIPCEELPFQIADPKRDYPLLVRTSSLEGVDEDYSKWADQPRRKFPPYRLNESKREREIGVDFVMRVHSWLSNIDPLEIMLYRLPRILNSEASANDGSLISITGKPEARLPA